MEARARVLGDQGHAPRAARRLRMDGAVAANACVTVGREGLFGESLRSAEQEANEVDKADAREPQTEREGESQKSVTDAEAGDGDKYPEEVVKPVDLRAGSEVEKKNAGVIRTEEANGTERPEAHEADGMRNPSAPAAAAASVVAAGALNPQAPPAAACTEAPEKAIAPEAEEIAAVPEARADGVATSATAAEEATADDVLTSPSLEEEVSPAERVFDGQSEPRSPAEPLVGAAAFFRGASSRPIFAPGRGSQNGWVGSTGHEDQATASFGEETGSGKEPEPEEAETERNEKTKNDLVESSVGSSEKESSGRLAVSEGDLPPVRDAVESPAGHGDKTGASGAERSPEEPFRGAAAFFLHANVTPSKVPASYGIGFALRAACSPAVDRPLTDRSAVDEGNTPAVLHPTARPVSVAIEPDQIGTTSILGEPTTPPKRIENVGVRSEDGFEVGGSFSASLQGVADAQARAVSPEERVPNAAAFFGRRAAASPVRPRVALPLQELKGFENRPAVEGSGKAVGTESGKPTKGALREKPLSGAKMSTQRPAEPSSVKHKSGTADQNPPPLPVAPSVPIWVETSPSSQVAALSVIADVTAPVADVSPATPAAIGPEMRQKTVPKTVVQSPEGQRALGNGVPEEAVSRLPKPSSEEVVPASLMESERDSDKAVGAETVEQLSDGQRRGSVLDMVRQHEAAGRERREEKTGEPAQVTKR